MANASKGHFVWFDLLTKDPKGAMAFYSELVGWKTQPFGHGSHYTMWVGSQGPLGGVMELPAQAAKNGAPGHWLGNVLVDDVDATVARAKKLGATIHREPTDIPTVGRFAVLADPQGASISVFHSSQPTALHDDTKAGEFCWSELMTTDSAAALTFYQELFGWKLASEMNMGGNEVYRLVAVGEKPIGGMMTSPRKEIPTAWGFYVETTDLDAAIARSTKMGGKLLNGPMEVPGGARIANLVDPQGAAFSLHQLKK